MSAKRKPMRSKVKWFIAIGILINLLLAGGIYVNHRLDDLVQSLNRPGLLFADMQNQMQDGDTTGETAEQIDNGGYWNKSWGDKPGTSSGGNASGGKNTESGQISGSPSTSQVVDDIAAQVGRPIDKTDMVKAGMIILKRLDSEEISYLYQLGRKGSMTAEERAKAHAILSSKLTADDVKTLKELGVKYGRGLSILNK